MSSALNFIKDFSITADLCNYAAKMDRAAKKNGSVAGRVFSRVMNFTLTSCSAVITVLGRAALLPFLILLGLVGSCVNFVAKKPNDKCHLPTVTDAIENLGQILKHALGVVILPFIGAFSPETAAKLFHVNPVGIEAVEDDVSGGNVEHNKENPGGLKQTDLGEAVVSFTPMDFEAPSSEPIPLAKISKASGE